MSDPSLVGKFTGTGCLPHQAEFAASFFAGDAPHKHLLVGAPGSGKGFAAAAIINHALSSGQAHRVLLLAPSALLAQWQIAIKRDHPNAPAVIVDRRRLRELESDRPVGEEIWPGDSIAILSIDFAKQADVADILSRSSWDLLVVDEVHLATRQTLRAKLLRKLLDRQPKMRALFLKAGGLLTSLEVNPDSDLVPDACVTHWSPESLRDRDGKPLLPEVWIQWIGYQRTPEEIRVLVNLQESLASLDRSDAQTRAIASILLQSASSSLFALEQRLHRIRQRRNELVHGVGDLYVDDEDSGEEEVETQRSERQLGLYVELAAIADQILQFLDAEITDSKYQALLNVLGRTDASDSSGGRACIYSRFADTASYLACALREIYPSVHVVTGNLSFADRAEVLEAFARMGGILIATDSMEMAIPEVTAVVFYDVPLDVMALESRIGRFARIGRRGPIQVTAFNDQSDVLRIERLQHKVVDVRDAVSEQEISKALFSPENS